MHSEAVYVNTGDVGLPPPTTVPKTRLTPILLPPSIKRIPALLAGWQLGVDSEHADDTDLRVSVQLRVGPPDAHVNPGAVATELLGDFLYRSGGRPLRGYPMILPAPYLVHDDEKLYLYIKVAGGIARGSAYLYFVEHEDIVPAFALKQADDFTFAVPPPPTKKPAA